MSKLAKKIALITGGSSGIGKAIALRFIKEGANIIVFDIKRPNYDAEFYKVDIRNEDQIKEAFDKIKKIDILVNNAGVYYLSYVEDTSKEQLDNMVDINLKGTVLMSKHALPLIKKSKGNIINITSALGITPELQSPVYCSTKAAIIMLTKCMAQEYAPIGIRVNAILPGPTDTPLLRKAFTTQKEVDELAKLIPMKRIAKPEEIANVAVFLASAEAGYVTGGQYSVDGGESTGSIYSK